MRGGVEDVDQGSMSFREWIRGRCVYDCAICNRRFYDRSDSTLNHKSNPLINHLNLGD